jgi:hypothetical protein
VAESTSRDNGVGERRAANAVDVDKYILSAVDGG